MSFLSSLLNPSPEADTPEQRRESVASASNIVAQSPEQTPIALPQYTPPPPPPPRQHSSPSAPRHGSVAQAPTEGMQALASMAASSAPPPTEWNGYTAPMDGRRVSGEMRPGSSSGHSGQFELPPPPLSAGGGKMSSPTLDQYHVSAGGRKMSSATLDQYHVSSRSPEQRRPSMADTSFTLPPLKHVSPSSEHARRPSLAPVLEAHASSSLQMPSASLAQDQTTAPPEPSISRAFEQPTLHVPGTSAATEPSTTTDRADGHFPGLIKQENLTPQTTSPVDARRPSFQDMEGKTVASLKSEHSIRNQSPLRESSVPMPTTEDTTADPAPSKKRPAPKKKGTASAPGRRAPPSKKRKVEIARSDTPSSRMSKPAVTGSSKGTPANSSPAPSNRSYSAGPRDGQDEEEEGTPDGDDVYCLCRRPDTGTFMIGCDGTCDDWFHGKCVGIEERDKNLIDKYMCPNCTSKRIGKTTWKRICRRSGCRLAARIGASKGSKYCSDECGVLFFREMTANARGREAAAKSRASRHRKSSFIESELAGPDDTTARGGLLAAGEVRALLDSSSSVEAFKKLGEGVLSPPATPTSPDNPSSTKTSDLTDPADMAALASITERKELARNRHILLKDRLKFINMVKQAASRAVAEKELKPKDYCGFDPRLEWDEDTFSAWRSSAQGKRICELESLDAEPEVHVGGGTGTGDMDVDTDVFGEIVVCDRKKCARHHEWAKLATDDVRFEMADNGNAMRGLDKEEGEVRERAALRGRKGEGGVVVHEGKVLGEEGVEQRGLLDDGNAELNGDGDGGNHAVAAEEEPAAAPMVEAVQAMMVDS